ncbi:helicase superfamily c-terminal domain like protein [Ralstonia phage phiRSL1]|uniref:Helicase superfamily c-terminal domain like protein n=1 Tax=Ralstonia phage phiRSL1 TaxID=1980924 RepID=B2ZXQ5_9CAUD|nr:helicase superfamily c-terminal domain like protein [Ralstonia phage phiRSL1]BAG41480.1 helicase superfamily c-terminal domain like protein [Ralstonia phage phiRSL1]
MTVEYLIPRSLTYVERDCQPLGLARALKALSHEFDPPTARIADENASRLAAELGFFEMKEPTPSARLDCIRLMRERVAVYLKKRFEHLMPEPMCATYDWAADMELVLMRSYKPEIGRCTPMARTVNMSVLEVEEKEALAAPRPPLVSGINSTFQPLTKKAYTRSQYAHGDCRVAEVLNDVRACIPIPDIQFFIVVRTVQTADVLAWACTQFMPDELVLTLTGTTSSDERQRSIEAFNNGHCKVLIATFHMLQGFRFAKRPAIAVSSTAPCYEEDANQILGRLNADTPVVHTNLAVWRIHTNLAVWRIQDHEDRQHCAQED